MESTDRIKTRREEYADQTRAALIDAARAIFTAQGYAQAGVGDIAEAARVTRGAFYHHFADKQSLFEALIVELQQNAADRIRAAAQAAPDARARIQAGAAAFLAACVEPAYRRLVIQEAPAILGEARCREIGEAHPYGLLIGAVAALQQAGRLACDNPYLLARMIGSMICEAALLIDTEAAAATLMPQALDIVARMFVAFEQP